MFQLKTKRQKAESTKIQWVHFKTLHHERNHQTLQCGVALSLHFNVEIQTLLL